MILESFVSEYYLNIYWYICRKLLIFYFGRVWKEMCFMLYLVMWFLLKENVYSNKWYYELNECVSNVCDFKLWLWKEESEFLVS